MRFVGTGLSYSLMLLRFHVCRFLLRFVPIPQVAEFSAQFNVADRERDKADPLPAKGQGEPLNIFHQGIGLLFPRSWQGWNFLLIFFLTCRCYS